MEDAPTAAEIEAHVGYVAQQHLDGYAEWVKYALGRKAAFDRKVIASKAGAVTFHRGQLVQYANSVYDNNIQSLAKLIYSWSTPCRIRGRVTESYLLDNLAGKALDGVYSARRLRAFTPKKGSPLERDQAVFEAALQPVMAEDERREHEAVEAERAAEIGAALE
ncbi:hypothetical protein C8R44DRAFT_647383 [Mycena epipterygia]|nr:hypothetical protein C8R44DRAFT_647383 [Mycena epipterygia]